MTVKRKIRLGLVLVGASCLIAGLSGSVILAGGAHTVMGSAHAETDAVAVILRQALDQSGLIMLGALAVAFGSAIFTTAFAGERLADLTLGVEEIVDGSTTHPIS